MDEQITLSRLMHSETKQPTPLSEESLQVTLAGLALLGRHYRRQLDDLETQTYIQGLRDIEPRKLEQAFKRALETLKRMPLIADLRELANEKGTEAVTSQPVGRYCDECRPDGYILVTHPTAGFPYKAVRRCPCQRGRND